jgi:UDP-glucose 4-epimerase
MKSVLVTGGAGYIASHAVKGLRAAGIHVIVETAWRWRDAHPQGYRKATA